MLYETAARASEVLALNIEHLELEARRARVTAKGGATEYVYWASGTAHLPPRLICGRERGPVFLSERRPGPARRTPAADTCPHTGRARLGYDRALARVSARLVYAGAGRVQGAMSGPAAGDFYTLRRNVHGLTADGVRGCCEAGGTVDFSAG